MRTPKRNSEKRKSEPVLFALLLAFAIAAQSAFAPLHSLSMSLSETGEAGAFPFGLVLCSVLAERSSAVDDGITSGEEAEASPSSDQQPATEGSNPLADYCPLCSGMFLASAALLLCALFALLLPPRLENGVLGRRFVEKPFPFRTFVFGRAPPTVFTTA